MKKRAKKITSREKEIKAQIDEYVNNEYEDLYLDFDDYVMIADMLNRLAKMELILKNYLTNNFLHDIIIMKSEDK